MDSYPMIIIFSSTGPERSHASAPTLACVAKDGKGRCEWWSRLLKRETAAARRDVGLRLATNAPCVSMKLKPRLLERENAIMGQNSCHDPLIWGLVG